MGAAFQTSSECYTLTPNTNWQLGAVWFNDQLNFNEDFEINLTVNLGNNPFGADGIVMVFQQVGTAALGDLGGGLGFEGFEPSLGIEIDTFQNPPNGDPTFDHMALISNGSVNHNIATNLAGPVAAIEGGATVCDGNDHAFKVTWDAAAQLLSVYFDCALRLTYSGNIVQSIFLGNPNVYWGFSGATGGFSNLQTVCISSFATGLPESFEVCQGESVQLGVVGAPDGTFQWSPTDFLDDPTSASPLASPTSDIGYTVVFTDLCGEVTELTTEVVVTTVNVSLDEPDQACEGDTITLSALGDAQNYVWSNGQTGATSSFSSGTSATVTGSTAGCSASATVSLLFAPPPESSIDAFFSFCSGESLEISASTSLENNVAWSSGQTSHLVSIDEPGDYTLVLTSQNGCTSSYGFVVAQLPMPQSVLPDSLSICSGESAFLDAGIADTYLWSTGEASASINVDAPATYSVTLSLNECEAEFTTVLTVNPLPQLTIQTHFDVCVNDVLELALPSANYLYMLDGAPVTDSLLIGSSGLYLLAAEAPLTGCSSEVQIEVAPLFPPAPSLPNDVSFCEGGFVLLDPGPQPPETESFWSTSETDPIIRVSTPGHYTVDLVNPCGAASAETTVSEVLCDCPVFIPNAFTPDLDHINEVFLPIVGCEVRDYEFVIFNRWGEVVFRSNHKGEGWNGSGPGRTHWVDNGIYAWKLKFNAELPGERISVNRIGHVIVLR